MRRLSSGAMILAAACLIASPILCQEKAAPEKSTKKSAGKMAAKKEHVVMAESDIKWGDTPPQFPAGAKMAVMQGDPGKPGMFTVRIKAPDGYKVAAHWHPADEHLTVISGKFFVGTGDKLDDSKATEMKEGAFATMPARMHHYAWVKGETEVQVSGMGPFKLVYVNPADDPSKKAGAGKAEKSSKKS
jgi:quercetin dioxygenase-like cupin family protein